MQNNQKHAKHTVPQLLLADIAKENKRVIRILILDQAHTEVSLRHTSFKASLKGKSCARKQKAQQGLYLSLNWSTWREDKIRKRPEAREYRRIASLCRLERRLPVKNV